MNYQRCTRCVMDTSDPQITFDEKGYCNHCNRYFRLKTDYIFSHDNLMSMITLIKKAGQGKRYDCIIGISGGVDSSYLAHLVKKYGLRVLLVNLNNGYDTKIAQQNIEKISAKTGFPLKRIENIDSKEFVDLQLAYLKASVIDIEVVSDHAIASIMFRTAEEEGVKYILSGANFVTEAIMPSTWNYRKNDLRNLKKIHAKFGTVPLKTYPTLGLRKRLYYKRVKKIKVFRLLNYIRYIRKEALKILQDEYDYEDYGGKHCESIFTKVFQQYILWTKFNVDKRLSHLSTVICSNQMTRIEALEKLKKPPYNIDEIYKDIDFVLSVLGLTRKEFNDLMNLPIKKHQEYGTDIPWRKFLTFLLFPKRVIQRIW